MKKAFSVLFFTLTLAFYGCENHDAEFEAIIRLADSRTHVDALKPFLRSDSREVQQRAVFALGQMRDTLAVDLILPFLDSSSPELRVETVFALGQLGTAKAEAHISHNYGRETDLEVKRAMLEALGKIGGSLALQTLIPALQDPIPILRGEAALALGRMAYRKVDLPPLTDALAPLADDPPAEVRWRAVYALMRIADSSSFSILLKKTQDSDERVRMQAARGLGAIGNSDAVAALAKLATRDPDWRVRVNGTAALGRLRFTAPHLMIAAADSNEHVRLTGLDALGRQLELGKKAGFLADLNPIVEFAGAILADSSKTWRERGAAASVLAHALAEQSIPTLKAHIENAAPELRARLIAALGLTKNRRIITTLQQQYAKGPSLVKIAVLEALQPFPANRAGAVYLQALQEQDAVLTALACDYFAGQKRVAGKYRKAMRAAFESLPRPVDTEAAAMIFSAFAKLQMRETIPLLQKELSVPDRAYAERAALALEKLTGESWLGKIPRQTEAAFEFTYEDIRKAHRARAHIEMDAGEIIIEFFPGEAPLTVLNFIRLAEKSFFNGLSFHRVVPNFVIQGGDPRGDSWGSPGYAIRSEFNRQLYIPGKVGMASAGPDTEGCQFFITHSEQPHLDGKYTIFGRVIKGLDVVNAVQAGDIMRRVWISY